MCLGCKRHRGRDVGTRLAGALAAALLTGGLAGCDGADAAAEANLGGKLSADTALRRLAADLLPAAELRSGLPARGPIQLATRSRDFH